MLGIMVFKMNKFILIISTISFSSVLAQDPHSDYIINNLSDDLVVYYSMDNIIGVSGIIDDSGNGNHAGFILGSISNGIMPEGTEEDKSILLNSLNSAILTPIVETFNLPGLDGQLGTPDDQQRDYSISMWVTLSDLTNLNQNRVKTKRVSIGLDLISGTADDLFSISYTSGLWRRGASNYGQVEYFHRTVFVGPDLIANTSDDILDRIDNIVSFQHVQINQSGIEVKAETSFNLNDPNPFDMGEPHHVVFVNDLNSSTFSINVDALFFGISNTTDYISTNVDILKIGNSTNSTPIFNGNGNIGKIDSFSLWIDRALTSAEIFELFAKGVAGANFIIGDLNADGLVNMTDVIFILRSLFSGTTLDCQEAGDVNNDDKIDIADAILILGGFVNTSPCNFEFVNDNLTCLNNSFCN